MGSAVCYGLLDARILLGVFCIDEECTGTGSFFFLTTASLTRTADAKVAAIIAPSAAIPTNAWAGGTAANEKTKTTATHKAKLFLFLMVAPLIL